MVIRPVTRGLFIHGRGCVGLPGLRGDAKQAPAEALLLTFLKSPLSRSAGGG